MANYLLNIDEAIDRKFLVTKKIKGQAETGTIIHVMDAENVNNQQLVTYRVARFNGKFYDYQDYNAKFDSLNAFCKWAQPDNFIARNYESFSLKDIQHYIRIKSRTFLSFCLPLILILAALIWVLCFMFLDGSLKIVAGTILTLLAIVMVLMLLKSQKKNEKMRMYHKISSSWGVVIE